MEIREVDVEAVSQTMNGMEGALHSKSANNASSNSDGETVNSLIEHLSVVWRPVQLPVMRLT